MRTQQITLKLCAAALTLATLPLAVNQALGAEYWLKAAPAAVDLPNPLGGTISVPLWGYASCDAAFAACGAATVPGPALTVPAADSTLTVHLLNGLGVPTSLVINGLSKPMSPVWNDGSTGARGADLTKRVRSFDAEAAPNLGTQADYTWPEVKPGTYLYQSGTQPQVQVQMGLYGALSKNAVDAATPVRAEAYAVASEPLSYAYDNQATLLYSEIDPVQHAAIADGSYGTSGPTSTLDYAPKYFLINGAPFPLGSSAIPLSGTPGTTLLRLLNAGLTTRVPMIRDTYWELIAEDGKPYTYAYLDTSAATPTRVAKPAPRNQYTALLTAAKTLDVLLKPDSGGATYAIMDRRLGLSNNGLADGGAFAFVQYGAQGLTGAGGLTDGNLAPVAVSDNYNSIFGVALNVGAPEGVLLNDDNTDGLPLPMKAVAVSGQTAGLGTYALNTNGSFAYMPAPGYAGATDSFSYQVTDGKAISPAATVTINLAAPVAPALPTLDSFGTDGNSLGASWSQLVNTVSPVPNLQVVGGQASAVATNLGGQAIYNAASYGAVQGAGFTSAGSLENSALILKASGGTTAASPANFIRVRYEATPAGPNPGEFVVATLMGGSGAEMFVKQAAFAATGGNSGTLSAAADAKGLVTVFHNGAFVGGVQLPDVAVWKGGGRIGIQLQTPGAAIDEFAGGSL